MTENPYAHDRDVKDSEAYPELDEEDRALERMQATGTVSLICGFAGFLCPPLGVVAIVMGLRARSLGEPHALSAPGSANAGIVLGATNLLLGLVGVLVLLVLVFL